MYLDPSDYMLDETDWTSNSLITDNSSDISKPNQSDSIDIIRNEDDECKELCEKSKASESSIHCLGGDLHVNTLKNSTDQYQTSTSGCLGRYVPDKRPRL